MLEISSLSIPLNKATIGVAGDTLNTAVYLRRALEHEATDIHYITALGDDDYSNQMMNQMEKWGIKTDGIARLEGELPAIYAINLDERGERSFHYWRNASAARRMMTTSSLSLDALQDFDVIYLSGITLAILPPEDRDLLMKLISTLKKNGATIAYDGNYRPSLWNNAMTAREITMAMYRLGTIVLPSIDDEMALFETDDPDAVKSRLSETGANEIVLKRGADGPIVLENEVWSDIGSGAPVTVVDATAAGDSFNAGYLAARISGLSVADAAKAGHQLASRVITFRGAIAPI